MTHHQTPALARRPLGPWPLCLGLLVSLGACAAQTPVPTHPSIIEITKHQNPTKFIGEGRLSQAPEYIELAVTIQSECYATPLAASEANDAAVAKVMALLRKSTDSANSKDGVLNSGGFTQPFSRYLGHNRTVCESTFQKTTQLMLKTSKIADFRTHFHEIQRTVFSASMRAPTDRDKEQAQAVTFAKLDTPKTRLYYETREKLEQQALGLALDNARKKFEATAKKSCGIGDYRIVNFSEPTVHGGREIAYGVSAPRGGDSGGSSLEFDAIWINKLLEVSFEAKSGTCKS